jgi:hypothetical protein
LEILSSIAPSDAGPRWTKSYIAYDVGGRVWASLKAWESWVWLRLHGTMLSSQTVSERLGFAYVPSGEDPAWTSEGPSVVQPSKRFRGIRIMLRNLADVQGRGAAALQEVLRMSLGAAAAGQVDEDDDDGSMLEVDEAVPPEDAAQ